MHADNQKFHHNMLVANIQQYIRRYDIHKIHTIHSVLAALYRSSNFLFENEVIYEGIKVTTSPDRVLKITITI